MSDAGSKRPPASKSSKAPPPSRRRWAAAHGHAVVGRLVRRDSSSTVRSRSTEPTARPILEGAPRRDRHRRWGRPAIPSSPAASLIAPAIAVERDHRALGQRASNSKTRWRESRRHRVTHGPLPAAGLGHKRKPSCRRQRVNPHIAAATAKGRAQSPPHRPGRRHSEGVFPVTRWFRATENSRSSRRKPVRIGAGNHRGIPARQQSIPSLPNVLSGRCRIPSSASGGVQTGNVVSSRTVSWRTHDRSPLRVTVQQFDALDAPGRSHCVQRNSGRGLSGWAMMATPPRASMSSSTSVASSENRNAGSGSPTAMM